MLINNIHLTELNSSYQKINAKVELFNGSTLENTCTCEDVLSGFSVERLGEGKFFGYGICQKLIVKLIDLERVITVTKANSVKVAFGAQNDFLYPFPLFYVQEPLRDETTNEISITAYDALYSATEHTIGEVELTAPYTIEDVAAACASFLGVSLEVLVDDSSFSTSYSEGANFAGTENIREVLNRIAEATQTIYYINNEDKLIFKRLDKAGEALLTIEKNNYIDLKSGEYSVLSAICHATELGDNVTSVATVEGVTQYVRDNPFWDMREDIADLVNNAHNAIAGITVAPFECNWMGNYLLEIGDKIKIAAENDSYLVTFLLDDTITYDSTLTEYSAWAYNENSAETASNPTSLGEVLKGTSAKVDKVNNTVSIMASQVEANTNEISVLQINTESISASVTSIEQITSDRLDSMSTDIDTLTSKVEATMTDEEIRLEIQSELDNGVNKVTTNTGFTFDDSGLTVAKSGSEMTTQITEDGMTVYRGGEAVLTANNNGVNAANLHATTYLIIGTNSRFEDYANGSRTGCFWIGG